MKFYKVTMTQNSFFCGKRHDVYIKIGFICDGQSNEYIFQNPESINLECFICQLSNVGDDVVIGKDANGFWLEVYNDYRE